jgi:hypothetical protein
MMPIIGQLVACVAEFGGRELRAQIFTIALAGVAAIQTPGRAG